MSEFHVRGLYRGLDLVEADTEEEARAKYHRVHPGWPGTILWIKEVEDDDG